MMVSASVKAVIVRLRAEGMSDDEVGRVLGVSARRIRQVMGELEPKRAGVIGG